MAVPVPWSTTEESPGKGEGRRYREVQGGRGMDGQVRCWQMAAAVRSAHVPVPEPGLGARCPWAPGRRVVGAALAVPAKAVLSLCLCL